MHMIGDGLYPSAYLDLEIGVFLLEADYIPLEDIDLISKVYLLIVKFFDCHAAVDGGFKHLYL